MKKIILSIAVLAISFSVIAQDNNKAAAADTASLAILREAVEAHPDSISAHQKFIKAFRHSIPNATFQNEDSVLSLLESQYAIWTQEFPKSATVPFALGDAYTNAESPKAKPYLIKAVELDPKLTKALEDLSIDADRWGDFEGERAYLLKAVQEDPSNPDYAFYYANTFDASDPVMYRKLSMEVVKKFPKSERGAQALYWLAFSSANQEDKIKIYEELKSKFPPEKFDWSAGAMSNYFDLLLQMNPAKALTLAQYMSHLKLSDDDTREWDKQAILAKQVAHAQKFLEEHKPADAVKILSGVTVSRWSLALEAIKMLKAEAMDADGNTSAAYDSLLVFFAKTPGEKTKEKLLHYGGKLGKNSIQVNSDIWQRRNTNAKMAPAFKLAAYLTNDSVSLSDYRGKIVLLTFWFPGCGPCRGEFPHFQKVLSKFKGKDIVYLGINVLAEQNEYVVPFMKSSGYSFTPLHENGDIPEKAYKVRGAPTNFLIDQKGRIVFSDFMIQDAKAEQMLELMISSMLAPNPN